MPPRGTRPPYNSDELANVVTGTTSPVEVDLAVFGVAIVPLSCPSRMALPSDYAVVSLWMSVFILSRAVDTSAFIISSDKSMSPFTPAMHVRK